MEDTDNNPLGDLSDPITHIKDNFVKGDPSKIFDDYPEENFIEFYCEEQGQKIRMATYKCAPKDEPKALFLFYHGLNGTMKSSAFLAKSLADEGIIVVGYDYRGHGLSQGRKAYFTSAEQVIQDSINWMELMLKTFPNLPVYIGGISFGGFISFQISLRFPEKFKSAILLAPALKPLQGCFMKGLASVVGSIFPGWYFKGKGGKSKVTRNKFAIEESQKSNRDKSIPATTLKAVLQGVASCENSFSEYSCPVVVFMGAQDKVIHSLGAVQFIRGCRSKLKKLYLYENMFHNVLLEEEIYDVIVKVKQWVNMTSK